MERGRGRPTKLDPSVKEKLMSAVKSGHLVKDACQSAGISYSTFCEWHQRGRDAHVRPRKNEYVEFADELEAAESAARIKFVEEWQKHFPHSWQAIAGYMAVRWPEEFGKKDRLNVDLQGQTISNATDAQIERQLRDDPESRELLKEFYRRSQAFF